MRYLNRQPEEGINVTRHNALLHFLKLLAVALLAVVLLVVALNFLGASVARRIPFRYESAVMERVNIPFGQQQPAELLAYLDELTARLRPHMPVPQDMQFQIHYNAENIFNAYATLGGNLVFYRKLLRQMPNENALAMVVAHEMSHVLHRDPLAGMGGGTASTLALMVLTGLSASAGNLASQAGLLTQLSFTRNMESAADRAALQALAGLYGHVAAADTLFRLLGDGGAPGVDSNAATERVKNWLQEFERTHPLDENRIRSIDRIAAEMGWATEGELTPLPADFQRWLE